MQTVNFMGMHMFITCKPEMIRHILFERQKYVKMNRVSHDADRLVSQGVFSSEGEEWHRQRSSISPFLPSFFCPLLIIDLSCSIKPVLQVQEA